MSIDEFIKKLAATGAFGEFIATSEGVKYKGTIKEDGSITRIKVQSISESRQKIKDLLKGE